MPRALPGNVLPSANVPPQVCSHRRGERRWQGCRGMTDRKGRHVSEIDGFSTNELRFLVPSVVVNRPPKLFTSSLLPFHQEPGKLLQGISAFPKAIQLMRRLLVTSASALTNRFLNSKQRGIRGLLRCRILGQAVFPSCSEFAVTSRTSSTIWNASPTDRPTPSFRDLAIFCSGVQAPAGQARRDQRRCFRTMKYSSIAALGACARPPNQPPVRRSCHRPYLCPRAISSTIRTRASAGHFSRGNTSYAWSAARPRPESRSLRQTL